ncbi:MAG: hypothetical protein NCW75_11745 [Phycisphaera sp.]|nr:MAG: hypothetical protein NCW75_11745 [Phycisphaera sp.]
MRTTSKSNKALIVLAGLAPGTAALAQGFPAELDLGSLDGTNGFKILGISPGEFAGRAICSAGDMNGDGIDDMAIAANGAAPGGRVEAGSVYVIYGKEELFEAAIDLSLIDGTNGFVINGVEAGDYAGTSLSSVGDINGDGYDDLAIGAPGAYRFAGAAYMVFGAEGGPPAVVELSSLDGSNGAAFYGSGADYRFGGSVAGGDFNGDGLGDLLVGAAGASGFGRAGSGEGYVLFGRPEGEPFPASMTRDDLDGDNGFTLIGGAGQQMGRTVASLGDINGDGADEIAVGSSVAAFPGRSYAGAIAILKGQTDAIWEGAYDLTETNENQTLIEGQDSFIGVGSGMDGIGDIDGDGYEDFLFTAQIAGQAYTVFGGPSLPERFTPADLDGSNGFAFAGIPGDAIAACAGVGDINGDGLADAIVGGAGADISGYNAGTSWACLGQADRSRVEVAFRDFGADDGFACLGEDDQDRSGLAVGGGCDLNADGVPDILIGALQHNPGSAINAGAGYVIFGGPPTANPCRADLDGDGLLTIFDFLEFLNLFDAGDLAADFDGSGVLSFFDFLAFQNEFSAGC